MLESLCRRYRGRYYFGCSLVGIVCHFRQFCEWGAIALTMLSSPLIQFAVRIVGFMVAAVHRRPKDIPDKDTAAMVDTIFVNIIQTFLAQNILSFVLYFDILYF